MKTPKARARAKKRARRKSKNKGEYRSMFELDTAKVLNSLRRKTRRNFTWYYESESIYYVVPARNAKYLPDFPIEMRDGRIWYLETKGRFLPQDRRKHELLKEQKPDLDIRIFFMRDQPIRKGSKTKYSDWCRKRNIPFCVGVLNEEWFDG